MFYLNGKSKGFTLMFSLVSAAALSIFIFVWVRHTTWIPWLSLIMFVAGITALLITGLIIRGTVLMPVRQIRNTINDISSGDLTKHLETKSRNELGKMSEDINSFVTILRNAIMEVARGSSEISHSAKLLDGITGNMRSNIDEAAHEISSVATASEEMSSTSLEISRNCASAAQVSEAANSMSITGETIIRGTIAIMDRINEAVTESSLKIEQLGQKSDEIGEVINLINDIADQTNLLALNAAIEAARAGEHGRGFAVVADEVRKLAEKTTDATKGIGQTIKAMQEGAKYAVEAMEKGVKEVKLGAQEARQSGDALKDILKQVGAVTTEVGQIAVAAEEQNATTAEIARNIQHVSEIIGQVVTGIGDNAGAASHLAELSIKLQRMVGRFKLVTESEVQHLVDQAYDYVKRFGKEKAIAEFNNPTGRFVQGELYVFAQDLKGTILAHAFAPELVHKNNYDMKDPKGKLFVREMTQVANAKGEGWMEYHWQNPMTRAIQPKKTYVKKVDDFFIACGIFADNEKAMVEQAVTCMRTKGKEKALSEFSNPHGEFSKRDYYIFAVDFNGKTLAHGGNPAFVGRDMSSEKDSDGKFFIREMIEKARINGNGWMDYKWTNPATNRIEDKSTYFMRYDDVVLGCGVYKQ